ncbi:MAG: autotransporter-associated beta strand repeat-containing protein, partial [Thermoguttaceae bacterium]
GTESRKSETILGVKNTYGGNTYITTNTDIVDATNPFSGNLRLGIDNALPTGTTVVLGGAYSLPGGAGTLGNALGSGKLALAGRNQELAGLLTKGTGLVNRVVGASATLSTLTLNIASGVNNTYGGFLGWTDANDDNLALIKKGAGTLTLTAANSYANGTIVREGTLLVNNTTGSGTGSGSVTVETGATLGGSGTISGQISVAAGGHLAPGNSPGILHTGNVTLASGAYFDVELNGIAPGSGYDQLDLDGVINLSDAQLNVLLGFSPSIGDRFTIIDNDGVERVTGDFAGLNEGSLFSTPFGSQQFLITYLGGDGNDVVLTAVPEPSSLVLAASLLGLALFYRRRTREA